MILFLYLFNNNNNHEYRHKYLCIIITYILLLHIYRNNKYLFNITMDNSAGLNENITNVITNVMINDKTKSKNQNQLFKTPVPVNLLWDFLQDNFEDKDTYFVVNKFLYKKTDYNKKISTFTDAIKEYYYLSKRKYIDRVMTYNFFLTVIRQLCNAHKITYTSKLVYDKSSYEIEYNIYKV